MKYKLDTNTPIPPAGTKAGYARRKSRTLSIVETLRAMEPNPNVSFLVPLKKRPVHTVRGHVSGAICALRKTSPERKYATRYIADEKGIRVWRIQ